MVQKSRANKLLIALAGVIAYGATAPDESPGCLRWLFGGGRHCQQQVQYCQPQYAACQPCPQPQSAVPPAPLPPVSFTIKGHVPQVASHVCDPRAPRTHAASPGQPAPAIALAEGLPDLLAYPQAVDPSGHVLRFAAHETVSEAPKFGRFAYQPVTRTGKVSRSFAIAQR